MPRVTQVKVTRNLRRAEGVTREGGLWVESEELHSVFSRAQCGLSAVRQR